MLLPPRSDLDSSAKSKRSSGLGSRRLKLGAGNGRPPAEASGNNDSQKQSSVEYKESDEVMCSEMSSDSGVLGPSGSWQLNGDVLCPGVMGFTVSDVLIRASFDLTFENVAPQTRPHSAKHLSPLPVGPLRSSSSPMVLLELLCRSTDTKSTLSSACCVRLAAGALASDSVSVSPMYSSTSDSHCSSVGLISSMFENRRKSGSSSVTPQLTVNPSASWPRSSTSPLLTSPPPASLWMEKTRIRVTSPENLSASAFSRSRSTSLSGLMLPELSRR